MLIALITGFALVLVLGFMALRNAVRAALFHFPRDRRTVTPPACESHAVEIWDFPIDSGIRLSGWVAVPVQPKGGTGPYPTMLYFGGRNENVAHFFGQAQHFPDQVMIAFNHRGFGQSSGKSTESSMVADGLRLFDTLCTLPYVDRQTITVIGRSLGSSVAIQVAAQRRPARLLLISPFDRLISVVHHRFPWFPGVLLIDRFDSAQCLPLVKCNLGILYAEQDHVVPHGMSRSLLKEWNGLFAQATVRDADHCALMRNANAGPAMREVMTAI